MKSAFSYRPLLASKNLVGSSRPLFSSTFSLPQESLLHATMSPTTDTSSALGFLNSAAHLLASTAPEISAHLMRSRNELMFTNEIPQSDLQRQHICGCCGHIMTPGKGSTLNIEARKLSRKKSSRTTSQQNSKDSQVSKPQTGVSKVFTCGNCVRFTKIQLPPPTVVSRKKKSTAKHHVTQSPASIQDAAPQKSRGANASSKKRAKSRKAGLQALLAQSHTSKSASLSLADFLKK